MQRNDTKIRSEPGFRVRVVVELDAGLALDLGNFILDKAGELDNRAIVALGHRLLADNGEKAEG
jgi:hypothetical protein